MGIRNYRLHRIIGYYRCRFEYDDSERGEADQSTNLEPLQLALVAVAPRGTCQAGGSSDGFCRGWQLLAELANEKNSLFLLAIPPISTYPASSNVW